MAIRTSAWVIDDEVAVRSHIQEAKAERKPKPRWWLLYATIPLAVVLLLAARAGVPSAGWRALADCVVSLAVLGAMGVWVHLNRVALNLRDTRATEPDATRW
jgi:hypothetical protein